LEIYITEFLQGVSWYEKVGFKQCKKLRRG